MPAVVEVDDCRPSPPIWTRTPRRASTTQQRSAPPSHDPAPTPPPANELAAAVSSYRRRLRAAHLTQLTLGAPLAARPERPHPGGWRAPVTPPPPRCPATVHGHQRASQTRPPDRGARQIGRRRTGCACSPRHGDRAQHRRDGDSSERERHRSVSLLDGLHDRHRDAGDEDHAEQATRLPSGRASATPMTSRDSTRHGPASQLLSGANRVAPVW